MGPSFTQNVGSRYHDAELYLLIGKSVHRALLNGNKQVPEHYVHDSSCVCFQKSFLYLNMFMYIHGCINSRMVRNKMLTTVTSGISGHSCILCFHLL